LGSSLLDKFGEPLFTPFLCVEGWYFFVIL